jgi:hypothetical protein
MLQQKLPLPRSVPSQIPRLQKLNPARRVNRVIQMLVAGLNRHAPKFVELSGVMMFGILPENHNARVAKNQPELAVVMKMTAQHAHHANITTKHRPAHHAPVAMMRHQVVPVVTKHQLARLANTTTKHQPAQLVPIEMKHQRVLHAQNAKKFMHQSRSCLARKFQLNV